MKNKLKTSTVSNLLINKRIDTVPVYVRLPHGVNGPLY